MPESIQLNQKILKKIFIREKAVKIKKSQLRMNSKQKMANGINVRETASNDGHMITVITDVTERKKVLKCKSRLSNAIDSIPSHVMFWDKDEKLIKANELSNKRKRMKMA